MIKFGFFTISEWEKEERWLEKMHRQGLKLVSFTPPCFYSFEDCAPEEVVYQLDYNADRNLNRGDYIALFRDCGWEYMFESMGYFYFRKPASEMEGHEEIFCDDNSRFDMITRVIRGRVLPLALIFFCCLLPQLHRLPRMIERDRFGFVWLGLYGAMIVLYITIFAKIAIAYKRLRKRTKI